MKVLPVELSHGWKRKVLVGRKKDGTVPVLDSDLILDSWREVHDTNKNQILKGHIA